MHLPSRFAAVILAFAPVFAQQRTWRHAERLLIGAVLAPGKRTVTSLLRIVGLGRERRFTNYHRVLNRAAWDVLAGPARLLTGTRVGRQSVPVRLSPRRSVPLATAAVEILSRS